MKWFMYVTLEIKFKTMFSQSLSTKKCLKAIKAGGILTEKLAEVVSHLLTLFTGTKYPAQSSAHPPV